MKSRTASLIGPVVLVLIALVVPAAVATDGPNGQATVGFGQWQTDPPLDRFTNPNDRTRNEHVFRARSRSRQETPSTSSSADSTSRPSTTLGRSLATSTRAFWNRALTHQV